MYNILQIKIKEWTQGIVFRAREAKDYIYILHSLQIVAEPQLMQNARKIQQLAALLVAIVITRNNIQLQNQIQEQFTSVYIWTGWFVVNTFVELHCYIDLHTSGRVT